MRRLRSKREWDLVWDWPEKIFETGVCTTTSPSSMRSSRKSFVTRKGFSLSVQSRGGFTKSPNATEEREAKAAVRVDELRAPFIRSGRQYRESRVSYCSNTRHEGIDQRVDYAKDTLKNMVFHLVEAVHLKTAVEGKGKLFSFDGEKHLERKIDG
jgi:hypothetical protein